MLRVRSVWTGVGGSPWYSNLYFDGDTSTQAQAAVDAVHTFLTGYSFQFTSQAAVGIDPFVASMEPVEGEIVGGFTVNPGTTIAGQETGDILPPATQMLATLVTPIYAGGRNIKGKAYMPGLTENANQTPGVVRDSYATGLQGAFNDLLATGPDLVVWSRKNGLIAPVSGVTVSRKWAVLRSRRD